MVMSPKTKAEVIDKTSYSLVQRILTNFLLCFVYIHVSYETDALVFIRGTT